MTPALFLLFNHHLTPEQEDNARTKLEADRIIMPPDHVQAIWKAVPPDLPGIEPYLAPVRDWLAGMAASGDYLLVQGDFGATYLMVRFAFKMGLRPVYSTTERIASEKQEAGGMVRITHRFEHRIFRPYGR